MNWQNREQSQNIEVDCLGKLTPLDGSPESEAALKCQAEIDNIRNGAVTFLSKNMPDGLDPAASRAIVEAKVTDALSRDESAFLDIKKHEAKTKGPVEKFLDHLTGKDTYKARLEEFKQFLDIPPIVMETQKGAMQKEHTDNPKN